MAFSEEQNESIRKELIREARHCGVTIGMRKTSVEQLAEAVGISKGSFYKFFDSKELLFFAALEDIHTEGYAVAQQALRDNAALPGRLSLSRTMRSFCCAGCRRRSSPHITTTMRYTSARF